MTAARLVIEVWAARQPRSSTPVTRVATTMKLSATPVRTDLPPPLLGQHTGEVLSDWLDMNETELGDLQRRGIV